MNSRYIDLVAMLFFLAPSLVSGPVAYVVADTDVLPLFLSPAAADKVRTKWRTLFASPATTSRESRDNNGCGWFGRRRTPHRRSCRFLSVAAPTAAAQKAPPLAASGDLSSIRLPPPFCFQAACSGFPHSVGSLSVPLKQILFLARGCSATFAGRTGKLRRLFSLVLLAVVDRRRRSEHNARRRRRRRLVLHTKRDQIDSYHSQWTSLFLLCARRVSSTRPPAFPFLYFSKYLPLDGI